METYSATGISLSDREKSIITALATSKGISFSAAARYIINDWANTTGNQPPTAEAEAEGYQAGHA